MGRGGEILTGGQGAWGLEMGPNGGLEHAGGRRRRDFGSGQAAGERRQEGREGQRKVVVARAEVVARGACAFGGVGGC